MAAYLSCFKASRLNSKVKEFHQPKSSDILLLLVLQALLGPSIK